MEKEKQKVVVSFMIDKELFAKFLAQNEKYGNVNPNQALVELVNWQVVTIQGLEDIHEAITKAFEKLDDNFVCKS